MEDSDSDSFRRTPPKRRRVLVLAEAESSPSRGPKSTSSHDEAPVSSRSPGARGRKHAEQERTEFGEQSRLQTPGKNERKADRSLRKGGQTRPVATPCSERTLPDGDSAEVEDLGRRSSHRQPKAELGSNFRRAVQRSRRSTKDPNDEGSQSPSRSSKDQDSQSPRRGPEELFGHLQSDDEDDLDSLGSFIVEDGPEGEAAARVNLAEETGILTIGSTEEVFGEYIMILARQILMLESEEAEERDPRAVAVCQKIERRLSDHRDKCVKSQSWNLAVKGFIPALCTRPYSRLQPLDAGELACAACTRAKSHASWMIVFSGISYEPEWPTGGPLVEAEEQGSGRAAWLQDSRCEAVNFGEEEDALDIDEESSDDEEGCSPSRKERRTANEAFAVGCWCAARVRLFHSCLHFKRHLQELVAEKLDLLMQRALDQERNAGSSSADTLEQQAMDWLAADEEFTVCQHSHYEQLIDMAHKYLSETGGSRYDREVSGRLGKEVHAKLDDITARARAASRNRLLARSASGRLVLSQPGSFDRSGPQGPSRQSARLAARRHSQPTFDSFRIGVQDSDQDSDTDDLPLIVGYKKRLARAEPVRETPLRAVKATAPSLRQTTLRLVRKQQRSSSPDNAGRHDVRSSRVVINIADSPSRALASAFEDAAGGGSVDAPAEILASPCLSELDNEAQQPAQEPQGSPSSEQQLQPQHIASETAEPVVEAQVTPLPGTAFAQSISRTHLALGSALRRYHSAALTTQPNQLSLESWQARGTANLLIQQLQVELGFVSFPHNRVPATQAIAEIYMELSDSLNRVLEAGLGADDRALESHRQSCLALLENIRSRLY